MSRFWFGLELTVGFLACAGFLLLLAFGTGHAADLKCYLQNTGMAYCPDDPPPSGDPAFDKCIFARAMVRTATLKIMQESAPPDQVQPPPYGETHEMRKQNLDVWAARAERDCR